MSANSYLSAIGAAVRFVLLAAGDTDGDRDPMGGVCGGTRGFTGSWLGAGLD